MKSKKAQLDVEKIIQDDLKKQTRLRIIRGSAVVFFGTIAIIGFVISFYFFIQMTDVGSVTGNVIGIKEGNFYGIIILVMISLLGSILAIVWFRKFRKDFIEHRT